MLGRLNPFTGNIELAGIPWVSQGLAPTTTDTAYSVPTMWIDEHDDSVWILMKISGGNAFWLQLGTLGSSNLVGLAMENDNVLVAESGEIISLQ
jgi:hypothetical protein